MRGILLWAGLGAGLVLIPDPHGGPLRVGGGPPSGLVPGGSAPAPAVHAEAPPPGHTGGFGEPTCVACHAEFPVNEPGGELRLEGLPGSYEPGRSYELQVVLEVPETVRAGFQLSARTPDGGQAGTWEAPTPSVSVVDSAGVGYAYGTAAGGEPETPERAAWTVRWTAPLSGVVRFHAAANSANGDDSPFGDLVYATEVKLDRAR